EARQVAGQHEGWIVVTDASGQQHLNTLRPFGTALPMTGTPELIHAIFQDAKPFVTDLVFGKVAQRFIVAVAVPVLREGKVIYEMDMAFGPERLTRLLQNQKLPASWVIAINDRQRKVVARSSDAEARVGKPVVEWFAAATRKAESGIVTGPLIDGSQGQIAFQRLQEVPWVVALAVPVAELPSKTPFLLFLIVGVGVGCVAVGLALHIGRKITTPIARLADAGGPLVHGQAVDLGPISGIRQVRELQQAVAEASESIRSRYHEQEQAEETLRRANEALEARVRERTAALAEANEALQTTNTLLEEDIQERRQVEAQLEQQTAELQQQARILDLAPVFIRDMDNRIIVWTAGAEQLYGWTKAEALGQNPHKLLQTVYPTCAEDRLAALFSRGHWEGELVHTARDGRRITVASQQVLHWNDQGKPVAILEVNNDITERKRAEEEIGILAKFPSENPFPVLRVAEDGTILYSNLASLPLLESWKTGEERVLPQPWRENVQQVYAAGMPREIEVASGARVFSIVLVPIRDAGYVNLYGRDISDRKRTEVALRKAHDELERRVEERTTELSNAIQALEDQSKQLQALASELTLAEQRERSHLAELIHDGLQQLLVAARLRVTALGRAEDSRVQQGCGEIGGLLDDAIADARSLTTELSPPVLRTGGLLAGLAWLARWSQEKHHLTVSVQTPTAPLPPLPEDLTVLLFQSVRELLFNAVKYAGVPQVELILAREAEALTLTVADAGAGFDPRSLRAEGGTGGGFGLARIRHRLELLGGCLQIVSAPGRGSRVTLAVLLPPAVDQPPAAPALPRPGAAPQTEAVAPELGRPRRLRVLIVDDHKVMRQGLTRLLNAEPDMEVIGEAADGQTAVELARRLAPDVVTMDISMPGMNGIQATRMILAECPAVRVIGLSMFEEAEQAKAMRDAGAVDYLTKSAASDALVAAIRTCIQVQTENEGHAAPGN
ncbi:MAG TPA: response regulator, partial [Candidatus Acidoferrum sp.]|nr:response regulator [Candidatus Acidoferrum sp.]